jgi:hypothetical protein
MPRNLNGRQLQSAVASSVLLPKQPFHPRPIPRRLVARRNVKPFNIQLHCPANFPLNFSPAWPMTRHNP